MSTFILICLMSAARYFDIKIFANPWLDMVLIGVVTALLSKLIEKIVGKFLK